MLQHTHVTILVWRLGANWVPPSSLVIPETSNLSMHLRTLEHLKYSSFNRNYYPMAALMCLYSRFIPKIPIYVFSSTFTT